MKKNIVDLSRFPLLPADFGGAIRALNLNSQLPDSYSTLFYSLSLRRPNMESKEYRSKQIVFFFRPLVSLAILPLWLLNIPYSFLFGYTLLLGSVPRTMCQKITDADLIIIEEPHLFRWIYKKFPEKKYLLNQYNVEYDIEKSNFASYPKWLIKFVVRKVRGYEEFALNNADRVTVVSREDKDKIVSKYGISEEKISVLPNGFNPTEYTKLGKSINSVAVKDAKKFIQNKQVVLFIGGEHGPNKEALRLIEKKIAPDLIKDAVILVVGKVAGSKAGTQSKNIHYIGPVKSVTPFSNIADVAINPILSGSGSNIKLIEYLGASIATVSTKFGIRGTDLTSKELVISDVEGFADNINRLLKNDDERLKLGRTGRDFVSTKLTWASIGKEYSNIVKDLL